MATPTPDCIYISICTEGGSYVFALYAQNNPPVVGYASLRWERPTVHKTEKTKKHKKEASNYAN